MSRHSLFCADGTLNPFHSLTHSLTHSRSMMESCSQLILRVKNYPKQKMYAISEKEALAIIFGIKKFYQFLYGKCFTIETDHKALECIKEGKIKSQRLLRWALYLQNFSFKVRYIKGDSNHGPDFLTWHFEEE